MTLGGSNPVKLFRFRSEADTRIPLTDFSNRAYCNCSILSAWPAGMEATMQEN